jgi:hypothetical protein
MTGFYPVVSREILSKWEKQCAPEKPIYNSDLKKKLKAEKPELIATVMARNDDILNKGSTGGNEKETTCSWVIYECKISVRHGSAREKGLKMIVLCSTKYNLGFLWAVASCKDGISEINILFCKALIDLLLLS